MTTFVTGKQMSPILVNFYFIDDFGDSDGTDTAQATPLTLLQISTMSIIFDLSTSKFILGKNRTISFLRMETWQANSRLLVDTVKTWFGIDIDPEEHTFINQEDLTFFLLSYQKYLDKRTDLAYNAI